MLRDILIHIMEWIGTIAFAVSGSLVAISCSLDLFGVIIIGCITAVGGGIMRDILALDTDLRDGVYVFVCVCVIFKVMP